MPTTPDDIVNEALDELGVPEIGDMYEGSRAANVARRVYDTVLRGMHAAAPWNFARRQSQIIMRGDVSGQYHENKNVPLSWAYMYEWPNDCVHARYVLGLNAYALDQNGAPLYAAPPWNRPAPFLVTDVSLVNDIDGDWHLVEGHSPESTRVIATNQLGAILVYTGLVQYPDAWDAGFRRAFTAALAARLAIPCIEDKAAARAIRGDQLQIAKEALVEARVRDGNEGWTIQDHTPDWIRARTSGALVHAWYGTGWAAYPMVEDAGGVY
jgi:hypothetical protein